MKTYNIDATDGELGKINDLYVDDRNWSIRYASIDSRKWLPGRKILLAPSSFVEVNEAEKKLAVKYDKETIRNSPDVSENTNVSGEHQQRINEYYGWGNLGGNVMYAAGGVYAGNGTQPPTAEEIEPLQDDKPNKALRSEDASIGFRVHANGGKLGTVADFIYNDKTWMIEHIIVETNNSLLTPKYYTFSTDKIQSADWQEGDLYIDESIQMIQNLEPYKNKEDILSFLI
ncbi:PRC-barrel domain-containing protein [Oceanobacillus massiliensis]|uniref:PRC-barrel domain-containing protein n=1 Tax=Oceanobacillus massiliensis TaxID=1465765 RepID=UPI0011CB4B3F|nr:PRC-barrel domain-containing protein [Oceanobacillus massiliensis]